MAKKTDINTPGLLRALGLLHIAHDEIACLGVPGTSEGMHHAIHAIQEELDAISKAADPKPKKKRVVLPTCQCGAKDKPHTCPYKSDIKGDSETLCRCCDMCTAACSAEC